MRDPRRLKIDGAKTTVREAVYKKLREAILTGLFKPGEQLVEQVLADEMEVSRTPVREALRKLELEKLVNNTPYRGVTVTVLTIDDARQIYEVHAALDGLAARLAATQASDSVLMEIEQCIVEAEACLQEGKLEDMIANNGRFHSMIVESTANKYLQEMMINLQAKVALLRVKTLSVPERAQKNIQEHKRIVQALMDRDEEMAGLLAVRHIEAAAKVALKLFKEEEQCHFRSAR